MNFNNIDELKEAGFTGFIEINTLFSDKSSIPALKGVYLILYTVPSIPEFLNVGAGPKLYKKKTNPNVSISELESNWVDDTIVVNIGKAGGKNQKGIESKSTLRQRLSTYFAFGQGKDVGHYGGRLIWQLKNHGELIVCWKATPNAEPRDIEAGLIQQFVSKFKKRPFANLND